jgi:hypothetical protein
VAENRGAHRARDKADGIDGEGFERADPWVGMRKEQFGEDQASDGRIEEEIVPFDRGADGRGDHGAAKLDIVLRGRQRRGIEGICGYAHGRAPKCPNTLFFRENAAPAAAFQRPGQGLSSTASDHGLFIPSNVKHITRNRSVTGYQTPAQRGLFGHAKHLRTGSCQRVERHIGGSGS